ncbi:MAG: DUF1553 domain-containing protein [Acidobacteria bacterium]|nr:DUF1553 domain-containing protein [Acidobacteriota bacterium]
MRISVCFLAAMLSAAPRTPLKLSITPNNPLLFGKGSTQRLVVMVEYADGGSEEITANAVFQSAKPAVATVSADGLIRAESNGGAMIRAAYKSLSAATTALIQRASAALPASFAGDILPILTKYGCNSGSCHGALNGQNGFKLSLFGYEPEADFEMIVHKHDGRRIDRGSPENSLLLAKPAFRVQHGGGKLMRADSPDYQTLLAWIGGGAKREPAGERRMIALRVLPEMSTLFGRQAKRRLLVTARYSDGTESDVTALVRFSSNDDTIASVNASGEVTAVRGGETAIVVRGPGVASAARTGVVLEKRSFQPLRVRNFIDEHIHAKLVRLSIPPSAPADDAAFLRRAFLDIIGIIPSSEEASAFLASKDPDKRARLVDRLLKRPEYADYWAMYWGDHLNNTKQLLYNKGPYAFTRWLVTEFTRNVPYDQFVRKLITSTGNMFDTPAASYYPLMKKELDLAAITSQLWLGVSIECARCHNHPLERWTQSDFNGMAAFFSQIRYKNQGPRNNERSLYLDFDRQFLHPDTKQTHQPKPLDGPVLAIKGLEDRRELLADWMTAKDNPFFARALVNRLWHNFMGRGFVEPVDDFRVTNPATNEPLLDALAKDFIEHNYDLHHLIRRITSSSAYQLSSVPVKGNKEDTMAYSRYYPKRLGAEQLLDSISLATGVAETYRSLYPGSRAVQLPEPEIESYFLEVFDRPSRQLVCERKNAPTLNQVLHMVGGDTVHRKVTDGGGFLAEAVGRFSNDRELIDELYLRALSRFPDEEERAVALNTARKARNRRQGMEDVFWALLNSKEFLYNH